MWQISHFNLTLKTFNFFLNFLYFLKFPTLQIDHDVCSNYGNWLYSAGVGNDPRQDRKFNMIKQGLDYDPQVSENYYFFKLHTAKSVGDKN